MNVRKMVLLAAGALLASRALAQGESGGSNQQPPSDQKSWYQKDAEKAKELGQQGADAAKQGAESAGKKVNEGGQAATAKVVGTKTLTGKIADVAQDQVTVKAGDAALKLRITDSTQVTVDGEKAQVGSLKEGDPIRASYYQSGGESTAMKLEVKRNSPTFGTTDSTPPQGTGSAPGSTSQ
jgi:hypothetical protein